MGGPTAPLRLPEGPMPHEDDPTIIPIMRGRLVLVTERYDTPRLLVTSAIQSLGYPAKACPTGADTLAFLKLRTGSSVAWPLGLPDRDAGELAERARDLVPGLRVVLMAPPGDPSEQTLLRAYQDLSFLTKPVFRDKLAENLERLLGSPESKPGNLPSMGRSRRRRRPSGSHQR